MELYNVINEFCKLDFVKNHIVSFIIIAIVLIAVGAAMMYLYMSKIYMKYIINKNSDLKKKNKDMTTEIASLKNNLREVTKSRDELLEMNDKLSFYYEMRKTQENAQNGEIIPAIQTFINNKPDKM